MTRTVKAILLVLLSCILCGVGAEANTVTANSCSTSDVQAAVNQTSNGDMVTIPGGSATWNTTVTISSSHQISLNGGGCTVTWGSGGGLSVTAGTANNTEVTNFTFHGAFTNGSYPISFATSTSPVSLTFRLDHNTLSCGSPGGPSTFIGVNENGPGLIDHNSFSCGNGADEMIHILGTSGNNGWTDVVTPGGANMIFIEDNTFSDTGGGGSSASSSPTTVPGRCFGTTPSTKCRLISTAQPAWSGHDGGRYTTTTSTISNTFACAPVRVLCTPIPTSPISSWWKKTLVTRHCIRSAKASCKVAIPHHVLREDRQDASPRMCGVMVQHLST